MVRVRPPKPLDDAAVNAFIEGADKPIDPRKPFIEAAANPKATATPAPKAKTVRKATATPAPKAKTVRKATATPAPKAKTASKATPAESGDDARTILVRNVPAELLAKIARIQEIDDRSRQRVALRALRIGVDALLDELDH